MNMVATSENLFKQKYCHHKFKNYTKNNSNNGGDLMEESRSSNNNNNNNEETVGSSSRDQEDHDHQGWLQLSIGNSGGGGGGGDRVEVINRTSGGLVELDLINSRRSTEQERQDHQIVRLEPLMMTQTTMFPFQMPNLNAFLIQQQQEQNQEQEGGAMNWGYNSNRPMMIMAPPQSFLPSSSSGGGGNMRVINPPRRANSGIWFMLQAMQTQARQPYLPQISKTYLRIKDGRMTVRLLMKYLVRKLSLDSESEVEIRCRGHEIEGNWTLQHVRDNIWNQTSSFTLPHSSATNVTDHLMLLHYGRRSAPP